MDEATKKTITVDGNDLISKINTTSKLDEKKIKVLKFINESKKITSKEQQIPLQQKMFADYYNDKNPPGLFGTAVNDDGSEVIKYMPKKQEEEQQIKNKVEVTVTYDDNDKKVKEFMKEYDKMNENISLMLPKIEEIVVPDPIRTLCITLYYLFIDNVKAEKTILLSIPKFTEMLITSVVEFVGKKSENITKLIDALNKVIQKKEENEKELLEYYKGRLETLKMKEQEKEEANNKSATPTEHSGKHSSSRKNLSMMAKGFGSAIGQGLKMALVHAGKKSRKRCNKSKRKNKNNKTRKSKPKRKSRKNSRS